MDALSFGLIMINQAIGYDMLHVRGVRFSSLSSIFKRSVPCCSMSSF